MMERTGPVHLRDVHAYGEGPDQSVALPADVEWVMLTPAELSRYPDLLMHRGDLDFVIWVLSRGAQPPTPVDFETDERHLGRDEQRALWNAALVAYSRPFGGGVGERLDARIFEGKAAERHAFFLALRNRHVAHSVSEYEQAGVVVGFSLASGTGDIDLAEYFVTEELPGPTGVRDLLELALLARASVEHELNAERRRVIDYARANFAELAKRDRVTRTPAQKYDRDVRARPLPRPPTATG